MRILNVGRGLEPRERDCGSDFSLAFFLVVDNNTGKGRRSASPDDDEMSMRPSLAAYYWFYFSPRGRGVGGGL